MDSSVTNETLFETYRESVMKQLSA
jgi:hypothetical protein